MQGAWLQCQWADIKAKAEMSIPYLLAAIKIISMLYYDLFLYLAWDTKYVFDFVGGGNWRHRML